MTESTATDGERRPLHPVETTSLFPTKLDEDESSYELGARRTVTNFFLFSVLFSANHGCVASCLGLASARLSYNVGAWQSGLLYFTYTGSALLGATYAVKRLGSRDAVIAGQAIYCIYVCSFAVATAFPAMEVAAALIGAGVGGIGGGFLWTAQGSYFARASEEWASSSQKPLAFATSLLSSIFACVFLSSEVILKLLSTVLIGVAHVSWTSAFTIYGAIALLSTVALGASVHRYKPTRAERRRADDETFLCKVTAAGRLLIKDPKMKYMIGLNSVFGFSGAFLNSFVNGEIVKVTLLDKQSVDVGVLSSVTSAVAAFFSIVFGTVSSLLGKGPVLTFGAFCFFLVAFLFLLKPDQDDWGWGLLLSVYSLQGVGRATFEGTLRATFADFFPNEKEGAFANIILQNGLSSCIGFILSTALSCPHASTYCIEYEDGEQLHDVLTFELVVMGSAVLAVLGYLRASALYKEDLKLLTSEQDIETYDGNAGIIANHEMVHSLSHSSYAVRPEKQRNLV